MNLKRKISFGLRAKIKLAKVLKLDLSSVQTDKGELFFIDADKLDVGVEVFVKDADGADVMPENGEYTFGNQIAVVEDGIVIEIKEATAGELQDDPAAGGEDPQVALDVIIDAIEDVVDVIEKEVKIVEESLSKRIEKLEKANGKMRGELDVAKQALSKANLANAHEFANPNPKPGEGVEKVLSKGKEALKKFGL